MFGLGKPKVPEITWQDFRRRQANGDELIVVDIRQPQEWEAGHMPESVFIPLDTLPTRFSELDRTKPIIVVCRSGYRSVPATSFLLSEGFPEVYNLIGGLNHYLPPH